MSPRGLSRDYLSFLCARWSHLCLSFLSCPLNFLTTYFISYLSGLLDPAPFLFHLNRSLNLHLYCLFLNSCSSYLISVPIAHIIFSSFKWSYIQYCIKFVSRQDPPATQATRVNEMTWLQVMGECSHFLSRKLNSFLKFSRCNQTHLRVWI